MHMYACMGLDKENNRKHEITETQKALQINYREAGLHDDHCMHPASSTAQFFVKKKQTLLCLCVLPPIRATTKLRKKSRNYENYCAYRRGQID